MDPEQRFWWRRRAGRARDSGGKLKTRMRIVRAASIARSCTKRRGLDAAGGKLLLAGFRAKRALGQAVLRKRQRDRKRRRTHGGPRQFGFVAVRTDPTVCGTQQARSGRALTASGRPGGELLTRQVFVLLQRERGRSGEVRASCTKAWICAQGAFERRLQTPLGSELVHGRVLLQRVGKLAQAMAGGGMSLLAKLRECAEALFEHAQLARGGFTPRWQPRP
ncbi:MAG TPA: hypothetical protein VFZ61_24065 [Polyangiales bacterium]